MVSRPGTNCTQVSVGSVLSGLWGHGVGAQQHGAANRPLPLDSECHGGLGEVGYIVYATTGRVLIMRIYSSEFASLL